MAKAADLLKIKGQMRVPFIVGGIGPLSQRPFQDHLLKFNSATKDQEHIGYMLVNATSFPDRTKALKARSTGDVTLYNNVTERIRYFAQFAFEEGFDSISFICNTIHAWREELVRELPLPWISLIDSTSEMIQNEYPAIRTLGVLETDGTMMMDLYTKALTPEFQVIKLALVSDLQKDVMSAIYNPTYGIKATGAMISKKAIGQLQKAADFLVSQGAEVIIGGCTEIPLALNKKTYTKVPVIDPVIALAKTHLRRAMTESSEFQLSLAKQILPYYYR